MTRFLITAVAVLAALVGPAGAPSAQQPVPAASNYGFLRGNLHVHTGNSGDSDTPAADVIRWYTEKGFDFIVLTDHNFVSVVPHNGRLLVIPGIEMTANVDLPGGGPLGLGIHMNGWFIPPEKKGFVRDGPVGADTRLAYYESHFKVIEGLGGVASVNHPNDRWSCDAAILTRLAAAGLKFFEVYNPEGKSNNAGGPGKPSTEQMWDTVLTSGVMIYGIAADDAHHYYDADAVDKTGYKARRGNLAWVMVRSAQNKPNAIKAALLAGDFYSTNGVILKSLRTSAAEFELEIAAETGKTYTTRFIGSGGKLLSETTAGVARYAVRGDEGYVRAAVVDSAGKTAWVQPVRVKK
jgi:hypothetical protein